jgi:hypothetical protein
LVESHDGSRPCGCRAVATDLFYFATSASATITGKSRPLPQGAFLFLRINERRDRANRLANRRGAPASAGRLCWSTPSINRAFKFAFANIKPIDGIIVGMFPRYTDEVRADAECVRTFGTMHGAS